MFYPYFHTASVLPIGQVYSVRFFWNRLCQSWSAQGIITKIFDEDRTNGADKDTGIGKPCSDRLIVPAGVLHAGLRLLIKVLDSLVQLIDCGLRVGNVDRRHDDNITRSADRDSADPWIRIVP